MMFVLLATLLIVGTASSSLAGVDPNTLSCDPAGQVFLLLPHRRDCTKFYMCVHGSEVLFDCPNPLIFDFELQTCNWDWAVECKLRNPESGNDTSTTTEGPGEDGSGDGDGEIGEELRDKRSINLDHVELKNFNGHDLIDGFLVEE